MDFIKTFWYHAAMKARKKKLSKPTLASMTALYKKRGIKRPKAMAQRYMEGFKAGKRSK